MRVVYLYLESKYRATKISTVPFHGPYKLKKKISYIRYLLLLLKKKEKKKSIK